MHIKKQETFEVISESREEIMELLYQVFYLKFCKPKKGKDAKEELRGRLNVYGISQKYLQDYITSEKDVLRSINRMPNDDFLLDVLSEDDPLQSEMNSSSTEARNKSKIGENQNEFGLEDDIDDFFDFVVIDKEQLENHMTKRVEKSN